MAMSNDDFFLSPTPRAANDASPSSAAADLASVQHQEPGGTAEETSGNLPEVIPSRFHPNLLSLAENVGFTRDEAEAFGTPEALTSAVNAVLRRARQHAGVQPVSPPPAAPPPPPAPEYTWEDPDIGSIEQDQMAHPEMIRMAKSLKALKAQNDSLVRHIEEIGQVMPHLMQDFNSRREAEGNQIIDRVSQEMKLDPSILRDPKMQQRIGKRVMAIRNTYAEEGEAPPSNETLLRQVVGMLLPSAGQGVGQAPPRAPSPQAASVSPAAPGGANVAPEPPPRRRFNGIPTGRQNGEPKGAGGLHELMLDKGVDPGEGNTVAKELSAFKSILPAG